MARSDLLEQLRRRHHERVALLHRPALEREVLVPAALAAQVVNHGDAPGGELVGAHREPVGGAIAVDHVGREAGHRLAQSPSGALAELPLLIHSLAAGCALAREGEPDLGVTGGERHGVHPRPGAWLVTEK